MLNSHPNILAYGEVFTSLSHIEQGVDVEKHTSFEEKDPFALIKERNEDPVAFLENQVLKNNRKGAAAVGCKLFYEHFGSKNFPQLKPWLQRQTQVSIIHIKRW